VESGDVDVVPLQVVTVGSEATAHFDKLQGANEYTEAFYSHGLSVESAEATAEWMHRRMKRELGISPEHEKAGKRYSWGYGACPDLDDHATVFKLLPVKDALGMDMTEAFQLMPEQSTAAIIIHHPEAKYYAVRGIAGEGAGKVADAESGTNANSATSANSPSGAEASSELEAPDKSATTVDETVALERAAAGEVSLAESRSDQ